MNQTTIDMLDHLLPHPVNGTFIRTAEAGRTHAVAGGAPLILTDCAAVACAEVTDINESTTETLDHLRKYPEDGTFLLTVEDSRLHRVAGGSPINIDECQAIGGCMDAVTVNTRTLVEDRVHLREFPADGTLLEGRPSDTSWLILLGRCLPDPAIRDGVLLPDASIIEVCTRISL